MKKFTRNSIRKMKREDEIKILFITFSFVICVIGLYL